MKKSTTLVILIAGLFLAACSAPAPEPTPEPTPIPATSTPLPSPTPLPPSAWRGEWNIWMGVDLVASSLEMEDLDGTITSEFQVQPEDLYSLLATKSEDETILKGTWESSTENGTVHVILLENQDQFVGNLNGYIPFCGAKNGAEMPDPCVLDWGGEWQVWLGVDLYNSTVTYVQDGTVVTGQGKTAQGYQANFNGEINADGSIVTGGYSVMVVKGSFEVIMSDTMLQFSGNYDGQPLCGARRGAEKPETCLAP